MTGHVSSYVDPVLHIAHGERDRLNDDPEPHTVPDTGDAFCLCGHPNYLTCEAWPLGGVMGLTVHNVGGYYLTTAAEHTQTGRRD
jgi:hypothetical protein